MQNAINVKHKAALDRRLSWEGIRPQGEYYEQVLQYPYCFDMIEFRFHHYKDNDSRYQSIVKSLTKKWPEWTDMEIRVRARDVFIQLLKREGILLCKRIKVKRV